MMNGDKETNIQQTQGVEGTALSAPEAVSAPSQIVSSYYGAAWPSG